MPGPRNDWPRPWLSQPVGEIREKGKRGESRSRIRMPHPHSLLNRMIFKGDEIPSVPEIFEVRLPHR